MANFVENEVTSGGDTPPSKRMKLAPTAAARQWEEDGSIPEQSASFFDIFQRHYSELATLIGTCVHTITNKLFSRNLISGDVQDQVATGQDPDGRKALHNVKQTLKVDPGKLKMLVEVLREEPVFGNLTKAIMSESSCAKFDNGEKLVIFCWISAVSAEYSLRSGIYPL